MRKERVGFAVCGSFCTHEKVLKALEALTEIYETVIPIVSEISAFTDTRFGRSEDLLERLEDLTGNDVLLDIPSVEPIGPKGLLDVLVIAPATGNTIAKLAAGIADTSVTMAAKPSSLVADFAKLPETVDAALRGEQYQPILLR